MTTTVRRAAGAWLLLAVLCACGAGRNGSGKEAGSPTSTQTPTSTASTSPTASSAPVSIGAAACAGVRRTTPLAKAPAGCAALWAALGATAVPPYGLANRVPRVPRVENRSGGVVSQAQAQFWAVAANRANVWFRWAEANDQFRLLSRLLSLSLLSPDEARILRDGGRVFQGNCVLFPVRVRLFRVDSAARAYFSAHGQPTSDKFVFSSTYRPHCTITYVKADGRRGTLATLSAPSVAFNVGSLRQGGPLLGPFWFQTAFGNCIDQGRPAAWCSG
jgi:hypothetical protein